MRLTSLIGLCGLLAATTVQVDAARPSSHLVGAHQAKSRVQSSNVESRSSFVDRQISYETFYFNQVLDHFNVAHNGVFSQRYLVNTQYWTKPDANGQNGGPIFFYTGNEGGIDLFANNTGIMFEWAPDFGAMLVFAEHRYYGETMPFGNLTYSDPANLAWLTAEQALADYAVLIKYLKEEKYNATNSPVVAFGGSYGGMLASWFRIKYPQVVVGAIAASAPIWQFTGLTPATAYNNITTATFGKSTNGDACVSGFNKSWSIIQNLASTPDGRTQLADLFGFCGAAAFQNMTAANATNSIFNWISGALGNLPMGDYPYNATFLGPMPAYPVEVVCSKFLNLTSPIEILKSVREGMKVFYNFSGEAGSCYNILATGASTLGDESGWDYQSCTEMVMPIGQYGLPNDMFWYAPWNYSAQVEYCQNKWKVTPRPSWIIENFGGLDLVKSGITNIVFTNGDLDPWHGGGVLFNISDTVKSYIIAGGAHHLDLRFSNSADPPSVTFVRSQQKNWIKIWINGNDNNDDSNGLPTKWIAFLCIVGTAAAMIIGFYAYKWYEAKTNEFFGAKSKQIPKLRVQTSPREGDENPGYASPQPNSYPLTVNTSSSEYVKLDEAKMNV